MSFNPDRVPDVPRYVFNEHNQTYRAVSRQDYDQLLQLYREAKEEDSWWKNPALRQIGR